MLWRPSVAVMRSRAWRLMLGSTRVKSGARDRKDRKGCRRVGRVMGRGQSRRTFVAAIPHLGDDNRERRVLS